MQVTQQGGNVNVCVILTCYVIKHTHRHTHTVTHMVLKELS